LNEALAMARFRRSVRAVGATCTLALLAWHPSDNRIVLLEWVPSRSSLVRHEALHAILGRGDHPDEYFVASCGAVINAPGLVID
jgi:hypothetical protein